MQTSATKLKTLNEWLNYLETAHSEGLIDMGLERVGKVRQSMKLKPTCPIIIVGGTNGKGSVCAYLTQIYKEAGFKVGTLTSPHLLTFNERIAINGHAVTDDKIIRAFEFIEEKRAEISLTYFEFNTLAAVNIFTEENVDVMILEVGLGGRLDAVNIFDADVAVITSIGIDHQAFLGDTIEKIAFEKAGIMRRNKPTICGQVPVPESIKQHAEEIGANLLVLGDDFYHQCMENQWSFYFSPKNHQYLPHHVLRHALPIPALRGDFQINNANCALAALTTLYDRLPVDISAIKRGLLLVKNPGRFQVLPGRPMTVLDVGHNPHAARALRSSLISLPFANRKIAVFSILADKDIDLVIEIIKDQFDEWYIAPLAVPRGMQIESLMNKLKIHEIHHIMPFEDIQTAYKMAKSKVDENDRIVVFGSFHTVAEVLGSL